MATLIDVLDTAIKIGLGSGITALATYLHLKHKSKSESAKEYESRHRTLLEQIANQVEQLNHVYLKYWALLVESIRYSKGQQTWPNSRRNEFNKVKDEIFYSFGSLTSAESKLLLVGEDEAYNKLRELGDEIVKFRRNCYLDKKNQTEDMLLEYKEKIKGLREELYARLSDSYQTNFK